MLSLRSSLYPPSPSNLSPLLHSLLLCQCPAHPLLVPHPGLLCFVTLPTMLLPFPSLQYLPFSPLYHHGALPLLLFLHQLPPSLTLPLSTQSSMSCTKSLEAFRFWTGAYQGHNIQCPGLLNRPLRLQQSPLYIFCGFTSWHHSFFYCDSTGHDQDQTAGGRISWEKLFSSVTRYCRGRARPATLELLTQLGRFTGGFSRSTLT